MRWRRTSGDGGVEDMRAEGGRRGRRGRLPGGVGRGLGGLGLVGVIVAVLIAVLGGGEGAFSPDAGLDGVPAGPAATGAGIEAGAPDTDTELVGFVRVVVDDVQDSWEESFARAGRPYDRTTARLFTGGIRTGCGVASSATGPFYCPPDRRVYLDLAFLRELRDSFGAPGDVALAYVIAHEFGHHVQNVTGVLPQVSRQQARDPDGADELSVRLELQADCFAGIWGRSAYDDRWLEEGDVEEGMAAAAAVGDDRIQSRGGGAVDPDSFTHGTSQQRADWFLRGFREGDLVACGTFSGGV